MDLTLHACGPILEFPPDTWRTDPGNLLAWHKRLRDAVSWHNPWALLMMRPDGDVYVFDCTNESIFRAAGWGTQARLMFAEGEHWDPDWEES